MRVCEYCMWYEREKKAAKTKAQTIILPSHRKQFRSTDNGRKANLFSANLLGNINSRLGRTQTHTNTITGLHSHIDKAAYIILMLMAKEVIIERSCICNAVKSNKRKQQQQKNLQ